MECFKCINVCPSDCLDMDKGALCVRLMEKSALNMDKQKCTGCNMCVEICPIGELALSANDCSNCIVCKDRPGCAVIPQFDRASFFNSVISVCHFIVRKFTFRFVI